MNIIAKLEKYFNSGSTDKQNKRRLGGLLIAVTAMLLAVAIVTISIGGAVMAVVGLINGSKTPEEDADSGVNLNLNEVTLAEVIAKAEENKLFTLSNAEVTLTEADYVKMQQPYRPKNEEGKNLYGCESADNFALQKEAFDAFNKMVVAFYEKTQNRMLYVVAAYNVTGGNASYFTNALAVKLEYVIDSQKAASIYGVKEYEWLYDHAHEYGFVRVSNAEGEENIFRYVGLSHAKYIESKQGKNDESFYGLDAYINEIKASTPDTPIKISSVKKGIGENSPTTYYVYYMPSASEVFKLPNDKYTYTVMDAGDGGYIVTYCKADKK